MQNTTQKFRESSIVFEKNTIKNTFINNSRSKQNKKDPTHPLVDITK